MADLRKAARGRECQVRIPGVCNGNPETSVLAHIRLTGLCGTGTKPPDLIATIACSAWPRRNRPPHTFCRCCICKRMRAGRYGENTGYVAERGGY